MWATPSLQAETLVCSKSMLDDAQQAAAQLMTAVASGDVNALKRALAMDPDALKAVDQNGHTALFIAAAAGHMHVVHALIDAGVYLGLHGRHDLTALLNASHAGHHDAVQALVEAGDFIDAEGLSALNQAALVGHTEAVRVMVNTLPWESVCATDKNGSTALSRAASNGHAEVVRLLAEAMPVERVCAPDVYGCNALSLAAWSGHAEVVRVLVEAMPFESVHATDINESTALMYAARAGAVDVVNVLLKSLGDLPFMAPAVQALLSAHREGRGEMVLTLTDVGTVSNPLARTPLMMVAQDGDVEVVRALASAGVPLNAEDETGRGALIIAAEAGHMNVVHALIEAGVHMNNEGLLHSPIAMMNAVKFGHLEVLRALADAGTRFDALERTSLMAAAATGDVEAIRVLIGQGGPFRRWTRKRNSAHACGRGGSFRRGTYFGRRRRLYSNGQ